VGTLEGKWDIVNRSKFNGKNFCVICFKLCLYLCLTFWIKLCCKRKMSIFSLGFSTKVKACKNARQEGGSKSTSYTPGSVGECERMNPHILKWAPTWRVEVLMDSRIFKKRLQGQNLLDWRFLYIIRKVLKWKSLKWTCMTIWTFETQVMAKRKVGGQIDNLTFEH
jgi:hypothetical protein